MNEFFIRVSCLKHACCYHSGKSGRIRLNATSIEEALTELGKFKKGQPPSKNFACKPEAPQLFGLSEILIK